MGRPVCSQTGAARPHGGTHLRMSRNTREASTASGPQRLQATWATPLDCFGCHMQESITQSRTNGSIVRTPYGLAALIVAISSLIVIGYVLSFYLSLRSDRHLLQLIGNIHSTFEITAIELSGGNEEYSSGVDETNELTRAFRNLVVDELGLFNGVPCEMTIYFKDGSVWKGSSIVSNDPLGFAVSINAASPLESGWSTHYMRFSRGDYPILSKLVQQYCGP